MKSKKQLDRLFKEQFKNLDVTPPSEVWDNIAAALNKNERKKRVLPFWYKLAGVAAALIVALGIGSLFMNPFATPEITVNEKKSTHSPHLNTPQQPTSKPNDVLVVNNNDTAPAPDTIPVQPNLPNNPKSLVKKPSSIDKSTTVAVTNKPTVSHQENPKANIPLVTSNTQNTTESNVVEKLETNNTETIVASNTSNENKTNSLEQSNAQKETAIAKVEINKDTTQVNKKSLIEYVENKNKETITASTEPPTNRWEVAPTVAPVYYNTLGNGSSIDPQFSNTSKSGDVNYSYGVKVSYAINNKLSLRTGLNKVDLSYTTNNIEFAIASASEGLQSIDYKTGDYVVAVGNKGTLPVPPSSIPTVTDDGTIIVPRQGVIPGSLVQELDYFEIPLELKYNLLQKRFGINVLGGMSTLLLNNNQVEIISDNFQSEIGSANNLNPISFSTNVGLGFDYKFSKRLVFNLEPMFKYQLNPYSDNSIDFKPFFMGVYSGFSFKF